MAEPSEQLLALVAAATLHDISFMELVARRTELDPEVSQEAKDEEAEPRYGLQVDIDPEAGRFRLRLRVELAPRVGPVVAEAAAEYEVENFADHDLTERVLIEYANAVGVMAMLPYLRQAIADLTQRVFDSPLLMPVIPRGAITFSVPGAEDSAEPGS